MKKTNTKLLITAIILFSFLIFRTYTKKNTFEEPKNLISDSEALEMKTLFLNNQSKFINKGLNDNYNTSEFDNNEFTVSIEEMKNYINYAEKIANKENYKYLGLRFILGAKLNDVKIPSTSIYYNVVGIPDATKPKFPIRYDTIKRIPSISFADKILTSTNPKKTDPKKTNPK